MKEADKQQIAKEHFGVNHEMIESWLRCLSYVRNVCAHYGRLYNKLLPAIARPRLFRSDRKEVSRDKFFAAILALKKVYKPDEEWIHFVTNLEALIGQYNTEADLDLIGFPDDWARLLEARILEAE